MFALAMLSLASPSSAQRKLRSPQQPPPRLSAARGAIGAAFLPLQRLPPPTAATPDGRSLKSTTVALRELSPGRVCVGGYFGQGGHDPLPLPS